MEDCQGCKFVQDKCLDCGQERCDKCVDFDMCNENK